MPEWLWILSAYCAGSLSSLAIRRWKSKIQSIYIIEMKEENDNLRKIIDDLKDSIDNTARDMACKALREIATQLEKGK